MKLIDQDEDKDVAMMTKLVKKFFKKQGRFKKDQTKQRDIKDVVCYNCQEKGHLAKTCTNAKVAPSSSSSQNLPKKAFITIWGDSDDEIDIGEQAQDTCLMAMQDSDADNNIEVSSLKFELLATNDLVDLLNELVIDHKALA